MKRDEIKIKIEIELWDKGLWVKRKLNRHHAFRNNQQLQTMNMNIKIKKRK